MTRPELDDDALLTELHSVLATPTPEPSPAEHAAFQRALTASATARRSPVGSWLSWLRRPLPAFAAGAVCVLVALTTATALRLPITDPVRAVAYDLGFPVESVELVQTRRSMSELRNALESGDDARIATAADGLREHLARLDAGDLADVGDDATQLLHDADRELQHEGSDVDEPGGHETGPVPGPPSTTLPAGTHPETHEGPESGTTATTSSPPMDHSGDEGTTSDPGGDTRHSGGE